MSFASGFFLALAGALLSVLGAVFLRYPAYCSQSRNEQPYPSAFAISILIVSLIMLIAASTVGAVNGAKNLSIWLLFANTGIWITGALIGLKFRVSESMAHWLALSATVATTCWWLTRDNSLSLGKIMLAAGLLLCVLSYSRSILNQHRLREGVEDSKVDQSNS